MTHRPILAAFSLSILLLYSCATTQKTMSVPSEKVTVDLVGALGPDVAKTGASSPYQAHLDYREQYAQAAIAEMMRSGVPASITIAQGILESNAGQSELAQKANNHFGIKCGANWTGKSYSIQDDDKDAQGKPVKSCFRQYDKIETCFLDHSEFLRDPRKYNRYGFLFNLPRNDYKAWAKGLQTAGYATSPTYADKLIEIVERYELYRYDQPTGSENVKPAESGSSRVGKVNDAEVVLARDGETLSDIAKLYGISPQKVADYNDRGYAAGDKLAPNTRIYIQSKKTSWKGAATHHFVRDQETMFNISQLYGIQLEKLLERNGMKKGQEPMKGEKIRLKGSKTKSEYIRLRPVNNDPAPKPVEMNKPSFPPGMEPDTDVVIDPNDPTPSRPPEYTPPADPPGAQYHVVQRGETLFGVARKYNTTVTKLKELNRMSTDQINVGQKLRVQ